MYCSVTQYRDRTKMHAADTSEHADEEVEMQSTGCGIGSVANAGA